MSAPAVETPTPVVAAFSFSPPVSPDEIAGWQGTLDAAIPPSDHVSHLRIVWEPGDPWAPVGRWMLYDCTPRVVFEAAADRRRLLGCGEWDNADAILLRDLDGPSPREIGGHYDTVLRAFVSDGTRNCTLTQWRLWQAHQVYGLPFWVIQGSRGGHKWALSSSEQRTLRFRGLPDQIPAPGALPYAPFGEQVLHAVLRYDKLRRFEERLGVDVGRRHDAESLRAARKDYLGALNDMVSDVVRSRQISLDGVQRHDGPDTLDIEQVEDSFINRGISA